MPYLFSFLLALFFNTIPFLAPGTGLIVGFMYIKYDLNLFILILFILAGSTLGRYFLAKLSGKFALKFLHPERNDNLSYFKDKLHQSSFKVFIFSFVYCALPTPSNLLFLAVGATNARLKPLLLGFTLGRAINYFYAAILYKFVYDSLEQIINKGLTSWDNLLVQLLTFILFVLFLLIDWRELFENKRLKLLLLKKHKEIEKKPI